MAKTPTHRKAGPGIFSAVLGVIGELLITAGIVIGLFIVWQVWWTDIGANREQSAQISQLQEEYGQIGTTDEVQIAPAQEGPPPEWGPEPQIGETMGIMRIPRFGYDYGYTIVNGTHLESILDKGAFGRYENSALPGQVGNFSTAAHRQTYGAPMRDVANLEIGDPIIVETPDTFLIFKMVDEEIVAPDETWTIAADPFAALKAEKTGTAPEPPTRRLLTITTCHPPFVSNERWVVHAEFDHWTKRSDGLPEELVDPAKPKGA